MSQDTCLALERGWGPSRAYGLGQTCRGPEGVWGHGLKEVGISIRVLRRHEEFASWRQYGIGR